MSGVVEASLARICENIPSAESDYVCSVFEDAGREVIEAIVNWMIGGEGGEEVVGNHFSSTKTN